MLINGSAINEGVIDGAAGVVAPPREALIKHRKLLGFDELGFDVKPYRGTDAKLAAAALIVEALPAGWSLATLRYMPTGTIVLDPIVEIVLVAPEGDVVKHEVRVPLGSRGLWGGRVPFVLRDFVRLKIA